MKSKDIVYTLGYIALFCVALYFVFGLLKISGQGLSSMSLDNNVIEGMTDKQQENANKKLDKVISDTKKGLEKIENRIDPDEFSDKVEELIELEKKLFKYVLIEQLTKNPQSQIECIQFAGMSAPLGALSLLSNTENVLNA